MQPSPYQAPTNAWAAKHEDLFEYYQILKHMICSMERIPGITDASADIATDPWFPIIHNSPVKI